jgi:hypothetical protein
VMFSTFVKFFTVSVMVTAPAMVSVSTPAPPSSEKPALLSAVVIDSAPVSVKKSADAEPTTAVPLVLSSCVAQGGAEDVGSALDGDHGCRVSGNTVQQRASWLGCNGNGGLRSNVGTDFNLVHKQRAIVHGLCVLCVGQAIRTGGQRGADNTRFAKRRLPWRRPSWRHRRRSAQRSRRPGRLHPAHDRRPWCRRRSRIPRRFGIAGSWLGLPVQSGSLA